jgi:dipeptidyl aminopeptidase/acylaminoacyl peptidase
LSAKASDQTKHKTNVSIVSEKFANPAGHRCFLWWRERGETDATACAFSQSGIKPIYTSNVLIVLEAKMVKGKHCVNHHIPLERLLAFDTLLDFAPHPSGTSIAVGTNISGQANLWVYAKGKRRRITPFTERRAVPIAWNRSGRSLLFRSDFEGNEKWQLHLYERSVNWYRDLFFEEGIIHYSTGLCWSPNGDSFVFVANRERSDRFDFYVMNIKKKTPELIAEGFGGYEYPFWFFPKHITACDLRTPEDSTLYMINVNNEGAVELTPHRGESLYLPVGCWKDGFFMITDEGRDFKALSYYSLAKGDYEVVFERAYDVETASVGSNYVLFSANEEGLSKLYRMSLKNSKVKEIKIPYGVVSSIKQTYRKDIFYVAFEKPTKAPEIYRLRSEHGFEFERITECFYGRVRESELIHPESYYYKSFDNRKIHALVYKPRKAKARIPLVVRLHDGPESQARPCYSAFVQYLLGLGIAVVEPNFRGSSGYGKRFQKLIMRDWGGGELRDIEYLMRNLLGQDWVNPESIGVCGASFGGFLTLACLTMVPEYWKVAAEWFGPSNLVTTVTCAQPHHKQYLKERLGDPDDPNDLKRLKEKSPARLVANIRCPLLIIQGAADAKVLRKDSDHVVEKIRSKGILVTYVVFNDEGHGFSKETNLKRATKETTSFLVRHLLDG